MSLDEKLIHQVSLRRGLKTAKIERIAMSAIFARSVMSRGK